MIESLETAMQEEGIDRSMIESSVVDDYVQAWHMLMYTDPQSIPQAIAMINFYLDRLDAVRAEFPNFSRKEQKMCAWFFKVGTYRLMHIDPSKGLEEHNFQEKDHSFDTYAWVTE